MYNQEIEKAMVSKGIGTLVCPSIPDRLKQQKEEMINRLNEINPAITLFEEQPELAEALTLIRKLL